MTNQKNQFLSLDNISYVCKRLFGMLNIPIYLFDTNGEAIFEYSYEYNKNPLYTNNKQIFSELISIGSGKSLLNFVSTKYLENYFCIQLDIDDTFSGFIFVGPIITSQIDDKAISLLIKNLNIPHKYKKNLVDYYNHMVIMDYNGFLNVALLLYHYIYQDTLDLTNLKISNKIVDFNFENNESFDILESKRRKDNVSHHSQEYEIQILDFIREGDLAKLHDFYNANSIEGKKGVHSKNPLRNEKNIIISFTSLVSHAAIEGGLDWELALSLSDFYIQRIEDCTTITDIYDLCQKMFLDYTERVHKIKIENYSPSIIRAQNYIFEHLYEKISLSQIAAYVSMNPSYLSNLFKKDVGIPISEYIQRQRIEDAKKMIRTGENSLADIYTPLGFIDQSHFSKTFKKIVGITPKEYKLLHKPKKN